MIVANDDKPKIKSEIKTVVSLITFRYKSQNAHQHKCYVFLTRLFIRSTSSIQRHPGINIETDQQKAIGHQLGEQCNLGHKGTNII